MYTSYFANISKLPNDLIPISISRFSPKGYKGAIYTKIAPLPNILALYKVNEDEEMFEKSFINQLKNLNINEIISDLQKIGNLSKICLCCYEKPYDFCHRHIVAEWFNQNDIYCKEYLF